MTERDAEKDLEFSGGFCRSLLRLGLPVIYQGANEAHRALNYWIDRAEKAEARVNELEAEVGRWKPRVIKTTSAQNPERED